MSAQTPTDEEFIALATSSASLDRSPKKNWVERSGGLPPYIRKIARAIHQKRGIPLDRAIPMAIGKIKDWAAGGDDVTAKTRAKAAAALAKWTALKAKSGKVSLTADAAMIVSDLAPGQEYLLDLAYAKEYGDGEIVEYRADSIVVERVDDLTGSRWLEAREYAEFADHQREGFLFGDPVLLEETLPENLDLTPDEEQKVLDYAARMTER
jgi:hypothetical protein